MSKSRLLTFVEVHYWAGSVLTTVMTLCRNLFRIKKAPPAPSEPLIDPELRSFALSLEALQRQHIRQAASRLASLERQGITGDHRLVSARLVGHRQAALRLLERRCEQLSGLSSIDDQARTAYLRCRGANRGSVPWG